jgi:hypothetical protein
LTPFTLVLLANFVTLLVAVAAAIKRPIRSYILIAVVALCACIASLYLVRTGAGTSVTAFLTFALFALLVVRIKLNVQERRRRRGR